MKKILCIFLTILLLGCAKEEKVPEEVLNFNMEGEAKKISEKYNIILKEIPLDFETVYGYSNTLEFYMKDEITDENRQEGYTKIIDYLKTITDDEKVYSLNTQDEFDTEKIDSLSKGIFFNVIIDDVKYRVNLYQYNNIEYLEKTYSTYSLSFEKK